MALPFIHDDFLLDTPMARRLYHEVAAPLPIIDYHCHLPPADLASNRRFADLFEIWLEGDHYKWRAMRANGVPESHCTGDAPAYEKFLAWARTLPMCLRNPLYHWSHLELVRYFGISELLDHRNAERVWQTANARLKESDSDVLGILRRFRVEVICTTDDPLDDLASHIRFRGHGCATRVFPTFRPDKAMQVRDVVAWNEWVDRLAAAAGCGVKDYADFLAAIKIRHDFFHEQGCRLSDHGLARCPVGEASPETLASIYQRLRQGEPVGEEEAGQFGFAVLREVGRWNAARGWVMQLHLGARRNSRLRMFQKLGSDTGFDSIGDDPQAEALGAFLDSLDRTGELPKLILYNLNPADNYLFATMAGNFNDGSSPGKVQFGSGWWFLDQLEGMQWQLNALSHLGLLSRFVGMLTDSRSFLSYPRHEYFRRLLCQILGQDAAKGLVPDDFDMLADLVERVSYRNACEYFPFPAMEEKS